jgi:hypothetical protein
MMARWKISGRTPSSRALAVCVTSIGLLALSGHVVRAADLEINVVEKPDGENDAKGFDKGTAERVDNPLRTSSTKDMVDKILGRLKEGDCIKTLNIYGHGRPGRIATGKGYSPPDKSNRGSYIDGTGEAANNDSWEPELKRLKGKFCKGATVNLYACNVGADDEGASKVWDLAKLLGVEVGGAVDKVSAAEDYPPHTGKNWQKATPDGKKPEPKKSN